MDWSRYAALSERWKAESLAYVAAINAYVERCYRDDVEDPGPQPADTREPLAMDVLAIVKEANRAKQTDVLRQWFPPAYEPFLPYIKEHAVPLSNVVWNDDTVTALIGRPGSIQFGFRARFDAPCLPLREVIGVGAGRALNEFVLGYADRIEHVLAGGARRTYRIPSGLRKPAYLNLAALPDEGAMAVFPEGVFLCRASSVKRLFPFDDADEVPRPRFAMMHGALSPDGQRIVCGAQDSQHHVLGLDGTPIATFGPAYSEYPHHATFSSDGQTVLASSCHLFGSVTVAASLEELAGVTLEPYDRDPRLRRVQNGPSVTASVFVGDDYVVGDRVGYLRAYGLDGTYRWEHACGSTITGLALSPDGTRLAVGTAAGVLHILSLHCAEPDPYQIGTANHRELIRFVCWADSPVLRW